MDIRASSFGTVTNECLCNIAAGARLNRHGGSENTTSLFEKYKADHRYESLDDEALNAIVDDLETTHLTIVGMEDYLMQTIEQRHSGNNVEESQRFPSRGHTFAVAEALARHMSSQQPFGKEEDDDDGHSFADSIELAKKKGWSPAAVRRACVSTNNQTDR